MPTNKNQPHRPAVAVLFMVLCVCLFTQACAMDSDTASGFTSTGVLDESGTNLDNKPNSGGNNQTPSTLAPYAARDANLFALSDAAWQTFLTTHWGNVDWVSTSFDYAHILDALAVNIELHSGRRHAGFAEATYGRIAANMYAYNSSIDTLDAQAFMALGLSRLYNVTASARTNLPNRAQYLSAAISAMAPVVAAEGRDASNTSMGLYIDAAHSSRRTSVNGAAILAALQIHRANSDATQLAFAKRIYAAWFAAAVDSSAFVADGIASGGSVDTTPYSYNFGLMLAAAVALHQATGEAHYLMDARSIAAKLMATFTASSRLGPVLIEPQCANSSCGEALIYRGLTARALSQLAAVDPNFSDVQAVLNGTVAALIGNRNTADGHWPTDWSIAGPSTQDPAADLAAALTLGYVALSAPGQCPKGFSAWQDLATGAGLAVNLPVNKGGDGTHGFAVVGPFSQTSQAMNFSIVSPLAGPALLQVRYALPDATSPSLSLALSPDGSQPTVSLMRTGGAQAMALSAQVPMQLGRGLNTISLTTASAPATALIDAVVVAPQKTLAGAACTPQTELSPTTPKVGDRLCGPITFTWTGGSKSRIQSDVIVDDVVACTVRGAQQSCTMQQSLTEGRHVWAVMEDGCSLSATQAFDASQATPKALTAAMADGQASETIISWPAQDGGQLVDVTINGTLVCAKLAGQSCVVPAAALAAKGSNQATIAVGNFCGVTKSSLKF